MQHLQTCFNLILSPSLSGLHIKWVRAPVSSYAATVHALHAFLVIERATVPIIFAHAFTQKAPQFSRQF